MFVLCISVYFCPWMEPWNMLRIWKESKSGNFPQIYLGCSYMKHFWKNSNFANHLWFSCCALLSTTFLEKSKMKRMLRLGVSAWSTEVCSGGVGQELGSPPDPHASFVKRQLERAANYNAPTECFFFQKFLRVSHLYRLAASFHCDHLQLLNSTQKAHFCWNEIK